MSDDLIKRLIEKLAQKCDIGDCWEWTGAKVPGGYASAHFHGKHQVVHRTVYEVLVGPIPDGLQLDHLCRNRACVNPDHLEPVTQAENIRRGHAGKASGKQMLDKTHCPKGHEYSGDNVRINTVGARCCRECERLRSARRRSTGR